MGNPNHSLNHMIHHDMLKNYPTQELEYLREKFIAHTNKCQFPECIERKNSFMFRMFCNED